MFTRKFCALRQIVEDGRSCFLLLSLAAVALTGSHTTANAKPEYAMKENKPCLYCHISLAPGVDKRTGDFNPTTRNARGKYYAAHDHSFAGYDELTVMGKDAPPIFHQEWKEELTDLARRVAVADVVGDGKSRLISLSEQPNRKDVSTLMVRKWDGKAFVTEFSSDTPGSADKLEVGKFQGSKKPAVIVTNGALWYWNGSKFVSKASSRVLPLLGATRMKDGEERVLLSEGPMAAKAYRVDPGVAEWLYDGIPSPNSGQVQWGDMHAAPDFFGEMGLSEAIAAGGLIGLWDVRKFGTIFLYYPKIVQDFDPKPDPNDPKKTIFVIKSRRYFVTFKNPQEPKNPAEWGTPELEGLPYDVALDDARGTSKPGMMVLTTTPNGKARTLYFFALD